MLTNYQIVVATNNRIYSIDGTHPCLSAQEISGRYYILDDVGVRKLTLNECFKLMGIPPDYQRVGSNSQLYQRLGNSVCIPMIKAILCSILS